MRLVFMGTPQFSVPTLARLIAARHTIVAVYSQPPRPAGRGMAETKGPVHAFAEAHGLPVLTPTSLKSAEAQAAFRAHVADAAVVVAYGLLLPPAILAAPHHGCYNLHASKLPRWRGAAPIQRAILAGDTETAVMVMRMDAGLDTGPVCAAQVVPIDPDVTSAQLHDQLSEDGAGLMVEAMAALAAGTLRETPQPTEGVTYAAKIDKGEARIDLARPARAVHDHVRGLSPFPGAWLETGPADRRERIKVLRTTLALDVDTAGAAPGTVLDGAGAVACGEGAIRLVDVQRAGKKAQGLDEFLRGYPLPPGTRLG
jgi:methionyl-tRNA formyltransferase